MTVTCHCHAYPFPHRLNGGKCMHETAAAAYYATAPDYCSSCPEHYDEPDVNYNGCKVVDGNNARCPAVEIALSTGKFPK